MSDKELSALCLAHLKPPKYPGGSWTLNPDALADAIEQAGWLRDTTRAESWDEGWYERSIRYPADAAPKNPYREVEQ